MSITLDRRQCFIQAFYSGKASSDIGRAIENLLSELLNMLSHALKRLYFNGETARIQSWNLAKFDEIYWFSLVVKLRFFFVNAILSLFCFRVVKHFSMWILFWDFENYFTVSILLDQKMNKCDVIGTLTPIKIQDISVELFKTFFIILVDRDNVRLIYSLRQSY
jgi:hypothetical protein